MKSFCVTRQFKTYSLALLKAAFNVTGKLTFSVHKSTFLTVNTVFLALGKKVTIRVTMKSTVFSSLYHRQDDNELFSFFSYTFEKILKIRFYTFSLAKTLLYLRENIKMNYKYDFTRIFLQKRCYTFVKIR